MLDSTSRFIEAKRGVNARGGGRTHTPGDRREILSLLRLPIPPLWPECDDSILSGVYVALPSCHRACLRSIVPAVCPYHEPSALIRQAFLRTMPSHGTHAKVHPA